MPKFYNYMRISTNQEKQTFNRQINAMQKYAKENGFEYNHSFVEEKSGKSFDDRPEFLFMESILQEGDTVVFKDLYRFTREAKNGYIKYMDWLNKGFNMVFIDNPTISSDYIRQMLKTASEQDIVTRTAMESIINILLIVELDRGEKQREYISKTIKDGIRASSNKCGREKGHLDKLTEALKEDIYIYQRDRKITQAQLMKKHKVSKNTLRKYIKILT